MGRKYLDFEVIKESWNKYSLQDGTKLKVRTILKSVWVDRTDVKTKHNTEIETHHVLLCDPMVQGEPDTEQYTKKQLKEGVEVAHCPYATLQYEPSEYELDDRSRIVLHTALINIARTRLFDAVGDRIYIVELTGQMNVAPPQN